VYVTDKRTSRILAERTAEEETKTGGKNMFTNNVDSCMLDFCVCLNRWYLVSDDKFTCFETFHECGRETELPNKTLCFA